LLIEFSLDLNICDLSKFIKPNTRIKSMQAETSAVEALEISKNRLRSVFDLLALPSLILSTIKGVRRLLGGPCL
jgi:hypothetical protein